MRAADERLRGAEDTFEGAAKHGDEASASAMFRTGQPRIVDPGIVPQRPSFPNLPLAVLSAVAIAIALCLVWSGTSCRKSLAELWGSQSWLPPPFEAARVPGCPGFRKKPASKSFH